jgi:hypothetical protein
MVEPSENDELMQLLAARSKALVDENLEYFEQLLSENFYYTNANGKVFDKNEYIEYFIKSKKLKWQAQEIDDVTIRRYENIAIITCRIHDSASFQGESFDGYFRSTQVFVKLIGQWRYVTGQTTTIV